MKKVPKKLKNSAIEQKRLIKVLDKILSLLVRGRDKGKPCIDLCGDSKYVWQAGHFRRRGMMSTRFNPKNVNRQQSNCNFYLSNKVDEIRHERGIDIRWGVGTAEELYQISIRTKNWSCDELRELIAAAKKGMEKYEEVYYKQII